MRTDNKQEFPLHISSHLNAYGLHWKYDQKIVEMHCKNVAQMAVNDFAENKKEQQISFN